MPLTSDQLARLQSRFKNLIVHPSCTIIDSWFDDDVTLAANVTIHNSKIGPNSTIHENAVITNSSLGQNTIVPPNAMITNTTQGVFPNHDPDHALPLAEFLLEKLPQIHVLHRFRAANGDSQLRLNYPVNKESLVIDVGGYQGDFAHEIHARYQSTIHIFEPITSFAEQLVARFKSLPNIHVHPTGLAATNRSEHISLAAESSSTIKQSSAPTQLIRLQSASDFFHILPGPINLLKINIEGGEYELLDHLLAYNLLPRIHHLQIQFHNFAPNAVDHRRQIRAHLRKTHTEQWNYPFIWESWSLSSLISGQD